MFLRGRKTMPCPRDTQVGVSMIILLLMIGVVGVGIFFSVAHSGNEGRLDRDRKTEIALARARQALIDYAVQYDLTHVTQSAGYLLCPDDGAGVEGQAALSCGAANISVIGKLPWKTLRMEDLRDSSGECLWYAVSGTYKYNAKTDIPFNWDAQGQFQVYRQEDATNKTLVAGNSTDSGVVAVIIAPGPAKGAAQVRASSAATPICGGDYVPSHYLDSAVGIDNWALASTAAAGTTTQFVEGPESDTFNDRLVYITSADIFSAIERRHDFYGTDPTNGIIRVMLKTAAECIAANPSSGNKLAWAAGNNNFTSLQIFDDWTKYVSTSNVRVGRVPLSSLSLGSACADLQSNPWWFEWQDHFFYALAQGQTPGSPAGDCLGDGSCLSVVGTSGTGLYAGVVLFGGRKLSGQNRSDPLLLPPPTNQLNPMNYFEGVNATSLSGTGGTNFIAQNNPRDLVANDLAFCINPDLSVFDCH